MGVSTVLNNVQAKETSSKAKGDANVPSGFILKLYEMCSGAPDDVICVSRFCAVHGHPWTSFPFEKAF